MKLSAVIHTKCIFLAVTVICNWGSPSCSDKARVKPVVLSFVLSEERYRSPGSQ